MKILMTGMSARSVGSTKIRYDFFNVPDLLRRILIEEGHEVDMRVVGIDESDTLEEYDRILCQLNWASSLSSMHAHENGLAMWRANAIPGRLRVYVDDWRTEVLADDIWYHLHQDKGWTRHTEKFRPKEYARLTEEQRQNVRLAYRQLIVGEYSRGMTTPLLAPFFPWGTGPEGFFGVARERLAVDFHTWDPSPWVEEHGAWPAAQELYGASHERHPFVNREHQWVLASLQNHDRWLKKLDPLWPVYQMGGVKKGGGGIRAGGPDKVVPEHAVVRAYSMSQGLLSPPYKSAGSGYWRVRFNYAVLAGTIIYPGMADGEAIGPAFTNELADIEAATDDERADLVVRQALQLRTSPRGVSLGSIREWLL